MGKPKRRKSFLISFREAIIIIPMMTPMELKIVELVMLLFIFLPTQDASLDNVRTGRSEHSC